MVEKGYKARETSTHVLADINLRSAVPVLAMLIMLIMLRVVMGLRVVGLGLGVLLVMVTWRALAVVL